MIGAGVRGFAAIAAAGAMLLLPSAASALHVGGATYTGPINGGGTVEIDISSDGTSTTRFTVVDIPTAPLGGGACPATSTATSNSPIAISLLNSDTNAHWFTTFTGPSEGMGGVLAFDGYDDRHNELSGRLAYRDGNCANLDASGGFAGGNVHWRAQRNGGCFNSDAYTSAKQRLEALKAQEGPLRAKIKKLAKKIKKAEAQGNEDKARRLTKKRRKARRELKKVVDERAAAQREFDYACPDVPQLF